MQFLTQLIYKLYEINELKLKCSTHLIKCI
jgi:hypothetical protein